MLLAGGARNGMRGVSSDPYLRNTSCASHGATPAVRPSTVAAAPVTSRRQDLPDVKPAAREEVAAQALRLTLRSMDDHAGTPLVQEYGCGTLYNLVLANPQAARASILHEGGVPLVLHAMRTHAMVAGVQLNASALIKELAEYQPCLQELDECGARQALIAAIHNHGINGDLSSRAAVALRYLPEVQS